MASNAGLLLAEVDILRAALLAARDAIECKRSTHAEIAMPTESHLADEMDQASRDQDMGFALLLAGKDQNLGSEIEGALKRLDDGTALAQRVE